MALCAANLPRHARLRCAADFSAIRRNSVRQGGRCFTIRYRPNGLVYARLGLAVSRRVSRRAVERNRIKRLLRESFRRKRTYLPAVDFLVMARESASGRSGAELLADMDALWRKLSTLKKTAGSDQLY